MRRLAIIPVLLLLAACPKDKKVEPATDTVALDTMPSDLSQVQTELPPPAPDTFTPRKLPTGNEGMPSGGSYPNAPAALMSAVEREQSFSKFCFQEFGQKSDPTLRGGVAMIVSIGGAGVTDARVGNSNWSSKAAGSAVNKCLNEKAKLAWKVAPGDVKSGKYIVQLSFSGS